MLAADSSAHAAWADEQTSVWWTRERTACEQSRAAWLGGASLRPHTPQVRGQALPQCGGDVFGDAPIAFGIWMDIIVEERSLTG